MKSFWRKILQRTRTEFQWLGNWQKINENNNIIMFIDLFIHFIDRALCDVYPWLAVTEDALIWSGFSINWQVRWTDWTARIRWRWKRTVAVVRHWRVGHGKRRANNTKRWQQLSDLREGAYKKGFYVHHKVQIMSRWGQSQRLELPTS